MGSDKTMSGKESALMPKVCGHRGAAGHAPENTLASIKKAASLGVRWVEFDTKLTADGVAVLFHDDDLGRTTDGAGLMAETSLADVRCLDAGSWFGEEFQGEGVPTLEDAIRELSALGLGANVEIIQGPFSGMVGVVEEVRGEKQFILSIPSIRQGIRFCVDSSDIQIIKGHAA